MKSKRNFIAAGIIIVILVLVCGVRIFAKNSKKIDLDINAQNVNYIEIQYHSSIHKINNAEVISDLLKGFAKLKVEKENFFSRHGSSKNMCKVTLYNDISKDKLIADININSNSELGFKGDIYKIISDIELYTKAKDIISYCNMYLEEIRKENIYKYDVKGIDENTVEDIAELYNGLVDAKPIRESEYIQSDKSIHFETLDEKYITICFSEDKAYICYEYKKYKSYFECKTD